MDKTKEYQHWNGKNINGEEAKNNIFLTQEGNSNHTSEFNCIVGVDTISGDELQANIDYDK